jgi:hypothetical protein
MKNMQAAPGNMHPHPALSPQGRGIQLRRRIFGGLVAMTLILVLLGCAPCCFWQDWGNNNNNDNPTTGAVKGSAYITTNEGKEPVGLLSVEVGDKSITSDKDGTFEVTGLKPGTYDIHVFGGDLGYTGKVTVTAGNTTDLGELALHGTLPPPDTDKTSYPATPEDVIRAYYKAVNEQDYAEALTYSAADNPQYNADSIKGQFEPYVKNIQVVEIERRANMDIDGKTVYFVTFTADYIKHYEAGSGDLQRTHYMLQVDGKWKIADIATG